MPKQLSHTCQDSSNILRNFFLISLSKDLNFILTKILFLYVVFPNVNYATLNYIITIRRTASVNMLEKKHSGLLIGASGCEKPIEGSSVWGHWSCQTKGMANEGGG